MQREQRAIVPRMPWPLLRCGDGCSGLDLQLLPAVPETEARTVAIARDGHDDGPLAGWLTRSPQRLGADCQRAVAMKVDRRVLTQFGGVKSECCVRPKSLI